MSTVPGVHGVIGLRVPGAIAYRHLAIRLVSTACKMALESHLNGAHGQADGDFEAEVVSAFGEAFNNIAVHGFRDLSPEPVQIEVDWDDEKISITFVDNGHIFDPTTVAAPDLDELPEHGMGLFIMRTCMDEVDYRPGPPNVLRLVKLRGWAGSDRPGGRRAGTPDEPTAADAADPEDPGRDSGVDLIPANEGCTGVGDGRSSVRA